MIITGNEDTYLKGTGKIDGGTVSMIVWTHIWVNDKGEPRKVKQTEHIWRHELAQLMGGN
jgi:hypothetical protein